MGSIGFLSSNPLHFVCPAARAGSFGLRHSILACEKRPKLSQHVQTSPSRQKKALNNANLFLDPKSAPALLRSPASILSVAAIGFLSAAAFLTRAARRFTADIAARTKLLLAGRVLRERLFARARERTFLQSALDATNVTLENTQSYLNAQRERATIAEDRLQKLQTQRGDLRELERRREVLLQQVANCEDGLAQNEQKSGLNEQKADEARRELEELRARLVDIDTQCDNATVELADLECAAFDALDLVQKAAEERQTKLEETVRLIDKARNMKRRSDAECNDVTRKVDRLNESVSSALSQVEEQRRLINDMTQRAEFIKGEIKRKRKDIHSLPDTSISTIRMQSLLDNVGAQRESVLRAISKLEDRRNRELEEYDALSQKLALREQQVLQLRRKLSHENFASGTTNVSAEQKNVINKRQVDVSKETESSFDTDAETNLNRVQSPSMRKQRERVQEGEPVSESPESESTSSEADVVSETELEDSPVTDIQEDNHDDLQISSVLELLEIDESASKPKRGRRSKVESSDAVSSTDKPKRRRRPRGSGTTGTSTETPAPSDADSNPKRGRGRPKKNEVMSSS